MSSGSPIIATFPTQDMAPNVQTPLTNQSGSWTPVLRGIRRWLHKRLGRCPPTSPSLLYRLAAAQQGPGGVTQPTDELLPRHMQLARTRACTSTVAEIRNDSCCAPLLRSDVTLKPAVWNRRPLRHPPDLSFSSNQGENTHTNGESSGRKVRCIRRSDALSSL